MTGHAAIFQLSRWTGAGSLHAPPLKRETRALAFSHDAEVAHPDYYRVRFDNGITTEITPTDHAAMFRFTFAGKRSQLVFDNLDGRAAISLDPEHRAIQGWSDVKSRLSTGATRLFFYAQFDRPIVESGRLTGEGRQHVPGAVGDFAMHGGDERGVGHGTAAGGKKDRARPGRAGDQQAGP